MKTLLLGCGYTLSKLAKYLGSENFVAVVKSEQSSASLKQRGIPSEIYNFSKREQIISFFKKYPDISSIVDSSPPASEKPTSVAENIREFLPSNVKKLIYLSSTSVYSIEDGSWIDEASQTTRDDYKGLNRLACEKIYRSLQISSVCLRISAIYGSDRGLFASLKSGKQIAPLVSERWSNRIHVDDLARIIEVLLKLEINNQFPQIFNCSDDLPCRYMDLISYYAKVLGIKDAEKLFSKEVTEKINRRISNKLLKDTLNFKFNFPTYKTCTI